MYSYARRYQLQVMQYANINFLARELILGRIGRRQSEDIENNKILGILPTCVDCTSRNQNLYYQEVANNLGKETEKYLGIDFP